MGIVTARSRIAIRSFAIVVLLAAIGGGLTACSGGKQTMSTGVRPASTGAASVLTPSGTPVVKAINAAAGGSIALATPEGAQARVVFPGGALAHDGPVSMTALTGGEAAGAVVDGFSLVDAGGTVGPALSGPALIYFALKSDPGAGASIVRWTSGGGYEVIPTTATKGKDGGTTLSAQVAHFSGYGVKTVSDQEKQAAEKARLAKYNWVIYVKDTKSTSRAGVQSRLTLDVKAVNSGGDIAGTYQVTAKGSARNEFKGAGGSMQQTYAVKVDSFTFTLSPWFKMEDLTQQKDDGSLAPLDSTVDYQGYGTMTMHTGGEGGTGTGPGAIVQVPLKAKTSKATFVFSVLGPDVRFTVSDSGGATFYMDGFIRGEGK